MNEVETLAEAVRTDALADLARLVDTNSFTRNPEGLIKAGDLIRDMASNRGIPLEKVPFKDRPDGPFHLTADLSGGRPFIGIIGHFDTVHPPESPFNAFEDKGEILTGPGVQDMKSGIIAALYGLFVAGKIAGPANLPVKIVFNADEETGSPDSRSLIEETMKGARAALIFEGRKLSGNALVTSRKGIMMGRMDVRGKAAHAGEAPDQGASAIVEAARKICDLDRLKDPANGVLLTTGTVSGGRVANQVPDLCTVSLDIRFTTLDQEARIRSAVREIMEAVSVPGCTTTWSLETARPPFEKTGKGGDLFRRYAEAAAPFGLTFAQCHRGGGSDGNFTANLGIPTLDGVGAAGDFPHTDDEYIDKASFFHAVKIFAQFLTRTQTP